MHLSEIRTRAKAPSLRQPLFPISSEISVSDCGLVQKPGHLGPTLKGLLQFDFVRPRVSYEAVDLSQYSLLSDRLRMEKCRKDGLLNLAMPEARVHLLDLLCLVQFALQNGAPFLLLAFIFLASCNTSEFAG